MTSKNYKFSALILLVVLCFSIDTTAQVGIGTATPNSNAMLDVESNTKGILPPRMTTIEKDALGVLLTGSGDGVGMFVFDTDLGEYSFWNGTEWLKIGASEPISIGNFYLSAPTLTTITFSGGKLGGGTTVINSTDFDDDSGTANRLKYMGDPKVFKVAANVSFRRFSNITSDQIFDFYLVKNGGVVGEPGLTASYGAPTYAAVDNIHQVSITGTISLEDGDYVELFARNATGGGAGTSVLVFQSNLVVSE